MKLQNEIIEQELNGIKFKLKQKQNFSFLLEFGKVFCVFDQNGSGNISFCVVNENNEKFFIKIAGAKTLESFRQPKECIEDLEKTIGVYEDLRCDYLIDIVTSGRFENLFYIVFRWADGECLFDHWNFEYYREHPEIDPPRRKFSNLSEKEKIRVANQIFDFMIFVESKGYVAVDFYDGSLMYDFDTLRLIICDIDFFRKKPAINDIGFNYWGTKRMKAPEEYQLNATIDSKTNIFTIGALFFNIFGQYPTDVIKKMYKENHFIPLEKSDWKLSSKLYEITLKAVKYNPDDRYTSIKNFRDVWTNS